MNTDFFVDFVFFSNVRLHTGIQTSILCGIVTFAFVEPAFRTVSSDLTLAQIGPYYLAINAAVVGLAVSFINFLVHLSFRLIYLLTKFFL